MQGAHERAWSLQATQSGVAERPAPPRARDWNAFLERRRRWVDRALLLAIGSVVALVSLPRLHGFALRANEMDAWRMTGLIGDVLAQAGPTGDLGGLLVGSPGLARRLEDVEVLEGGRLLRRHGYLFEIGRTPTGETFLRAWPWRHGRTGVGVFAWTAEHGLCGHPNPRAAWSGADAPPAPETAPGGWRRIAPRHAQ